MKIHRWHQQPRRRNTNSGRRQRRRRRHIRPGTATTKRRLSQQNTHKTPQAPAHPAPRGIHPRIALHPKVNPRDNQPHQPRLPRRGALPNPDTSLQRTENRPRPRNSSEDTTRTVPVGADGAEHRDDSVVQDDGGGPLLVTRLEGIEAGEEGDQRLEAGGAFVLEEAEGVVQEGGVEGGVEGAESRCCCCCRVLG